MVTCIALDRRVPIDPCRSDIVSFHQSSEYRMKSENENDKKEEEEEEQIVHRHPLSFFFFLSTLKTLMSRLEHYSSRSAYLHGHSNLPLRLRIRQEF